MDIKLGSEVMDKVTGCRGITTGKVIYLTGCTQYNIVPPMDASGKLNGAEWFDEGRVQVIGLGIREEDVESDKEGGPNRDCPK